MSIATKKIKAFTLAELLVTLALTAILVALSYGGLNYIQRLLKNYNEQSFFVTQITELDKRLQYQTNLAREIRQETENELLFLSDSGEVRLSLKPDCILLKHQQQTDSFVIDHSDWKLSYETLASGAQLVNQLELDLDFRKQKFHCTFRKKYDAFSKFGIDTRDVRP